MNIFAVIWKIGVPIAFLTAAVKSAGYLRGKGRPGWDIPGCIGGFFILMTVVIQRDSSTFWWIASGVSASYILFSAWSEYKDLGAKGAAARVCTDFAGGFGIILFIGALYDMKQKPKNRKE